jgi:renalase
MNDQTIAIIGAGLSGLACARVLADAGAHVTLFDKARGAGGRMSTRRTEVGPFDHGAQYFTARDPAFRAAVAEWQAAGVVAEWQGRIERVGVGPGPEPSPGERFVGTPGMSALLRHIAGELPVCFETQVTDIRRVDDGYRLDEYDGPPLRPFTQVVVAVPTPQAVPLLTTHAPALAAAAAQAEMAPCFSLMAGFDAPLPTPLDGIFFVGHPIGWAARDSSKPGRPAGERWVIHGHWGWSAEHLNDPPEQIAQALLAAFFSALEMVPRVPTFVATHRWRYALPTVPLAEDYLYDPAAGIGVCGDSCNGPRVEGAWLSGTALGRAIVAAHG